MAKLKFYWSTMNAGKTTHLLQRAHLYEQYGYEVLCGISAVDDRWGPGKISSRLGISRDAKIIHTDDILIFDEEIANSQNKYAIFIDEVQFLTEVQIHNLNILVHVQGIPVFCYGLKNNYKGELFSDAIIKLLAIADEIEEIENICFCGKKAKQNLRYNSEGKIIRDGEEIVQVGAEDKYLSVCNDHFFVLKKQTEAFIKSLGS